MSEFARLYPIYFRLSVKAQSRTHLLCMHKTAEPWAMWRHNLVWNRLGNLYIPGLFMGGSRVFSRVGGSPYIFSHRRITERAVRRPKEVIGPKGSSYFMRVIIPALLMKPIATGDFPMGCRTTCPLLWIRPCFSLIYNESRIEVVAPLCTWGCTWFTQIINNLLFSSVYTYRLQQMKTFLNLSVSVNCDKYRHGRAV